MPHTPSDALRQAFIEHGKGLGLEFMEVARETELSEVRREEGGEGNKNVVKRVKRDREKRWGHCSSAPIQLVPLECYIGHYMRLIT